MGGKPITDLHLRPEDDEPDERDTDWYQFCQLIDVLLESEEYHGAQDTLTGIQETVERMRAVSEGQRTAVRNIEAGGKRKSYGGSRRYEGYRRRRY